jgi:hypothetical protein
MVSNDAVTGSFRGLRWKYRRVNQIDAIPLKCNQNFDLTLRSRYA